MTGQCRCFAVIPAAGQSRRMGQHKLLLPWAGRTVFEAVVAAWQGVPVEAAVVVARSDDRPLIELCRRLSLDVVLPDPPPDDMKASVAHGLRYIGGRHAPASGDLCLVAPADMPGLSVEVIRRVIDHHEPTRPCLLVPDHGGRRGHPLGVPWEWVDEVFGLPADRGMDALFERLVARGVDCAELPRAGDLDTPDDYRRAIESA